MSGWFVTNLPHKRLRQNHLWRGCFKLQLQIQAFVTNKIRLKLGRTRLAETDTTYLVTTVIGSE